MVVINVSAEISPNLEDYSDIHGSVLELQRCLQETFPTCSDLATFNDRGFTPHLSVGQFQASSVASFVEKLRPSWNAVSFDVTSVCLISRRGYDDPFTIKKTLSLSGG